MKTDLAEPTDRGLIVSSVDGAALGPESVPVDLSEQVRSVGDVAVVGESDVFAREAITPRAENVVATLESDTTVNAGEAADIFIEALKNSESSLAGSIVGLMEPKIKERMPAGRETVGTERRGHPQRQRPRGTSTGCRRRRGGLRERHRCGRRALIPPRRAILRSHADPQSAVFPVNRQPGRSPSAVAGWATPVSGIRSE